VERGVDLAPLHHRLQHPQVGLVADEGELLRIPARFRIPTRSTIHWSLVSIPSDSRKALSITVSG
jgi:hypothetical protein